METAGGLKREEVRAAVEQALERYPFAAPGRPADHSCADGRLRLKLGRYGLLVGCANYPECRYSRPLAADPGDAGKNREPMALGIDPETGLPFTLRRGRYGRYVQRGEHGDAHARRGTVPMSMDADDVIHDPRHSYASRALALGESLPMIVRPLTAISGSRSMSKLEMRARRRWPAEDIREARYSSARRKRADVRLCAEKHAERDRHTAGIPDGGCGTGVARSVVDSVVDDFAVYNQGGMSRRDGGIESMTRQEFIRAARNAFPSGYTFDNPGGGTSHILGVGGNAIAYRRGNSSIRVLLTDLYRAFDSFRGQRVTSTDLRRFAPSVFDSNARPAGHSCNCTFLFHLLQRLELTDGGLEGRGVRGDPYSLVITKS